MVRAGGVMNRPIDRDDVIGLVYDAALAPQLWPHALESVAELVRADGGTLLFQDQISGEGSAIVARLDPAATSQQFGYYATRNPIRPGRNRALRLSHASSDWRTHVMTDEHALSKSELMRSEFYNDFLRPLGIHAGLMIGLALEKTRFATINLFRPRHREQFAPSDIETARNLQPHLIRAFELGLRLTQLQQLNDGLTQSLDRSQHAIFLADRDCRPRYANHAGELLARQNRGVCLRNGILCAAAADSTRKLHQLVAAAGTSGAEQRSGGAMTLARPGFRKPLSVIVAPLRSVLVSHFRQAPSAIICISDPETGIAVPRERLRDLFGLTPAETKVALELLAGNDPAAIAERLSLSVHTVRVHLARIMAKTDTSRQAELVQLLGRSSGIGIV